jgi:hypothetical protein
MLQGYNAHLQEGVAPSESQRHRCWMRETIIIIILARNNLYAPFSVITLTPTPTIIIIIISTTTTTTITITIIINITIVSDFRSLLVKGR